MRRHGLFTAGCLTAIPFVLAHIPGAFQNTATSEALVDIAAIALLAPLLRYLSGVLLVETGGSVLAVAVLHASFNASLVLPAAVGGWQALGALVLLAVLVAVYRILRRSGRARGTSISNPSEKHARRATAHTETSSPRV
jgi:membrane protease YdiL (CAAX protease family)